MSYAFTRNDSETFRPEGPVLYLAELNVPEHGLFRATVEYQSRIVQSQTLYLQKTHSGVPRVILERNYIINTQNNTVKPAIDLSNPLKYRPLGKLSTYQLQE